MKRIIAGLALLTLVIVSCKKGAEKCVRNWFAQSCISPLFNVQPNDFALQPL